MATAKKTTKKTTSSAKKSAVKKAPVKKTTTKKTVTKAPAKKEESKRGVLKKIDEDTSMKIRFFIIFIGILLAFAYHLPIGKLYGETQNGNIIIENIFSGEYTDIAKYIFAILFPVALCEISAIMMIIKSDRFTAILSIMITGVAIFSQILFYSYIAPLEIGWYTLLCGEVIEFVYSIGLFVSLPSMKNQIK